MTLKEKQINAQVINIRANLHEIMKDIEPKGIYNKLVSLDTQIYKIKDIIKQSEVENLSLEEEPMEEIKNNKCDCLTKEYVPIRYEVIGYCRELNVGVSFTKQEIFARYDWVRNSGTRKSLAIKYCPFCGRKLYKTESEE